jgi:hypothetical protein
VPRSVHRHIIPGAVARVIEVAVYGLPIYVFDRHVNGAVKGRIAGEVIDP